MSTTRFLLIAVLTLGVAYWRLVPHAANFAPVGALALFAGAIVTRKWLAFLVPLTAMAVTDLIIYRSHTEQFDSWNYALDRVVVYSCYAASVGIGFWLRNRRTVVPVNGGAVAGAVLFFVVTNFAVWAGAGGFGYDRTPAGLLACYVAAIPFFQWTFLSDVVFAWAFFGGLALAERWLPALREVTHLAAAEGPLPGSPSWEKVSSVE